MTFDEGAPHRDCVLHPLRAAVVEPGRDRSWRPYRASGAICNLPVLAQAAGASGFLNAAPDADGILRRVPLVIELENRLYPALSVAAVIAMTNPRQIEFRVTDAQTSRLTLDERSVPLDANGNLLVRYLGEARSFQYISAADVVAGRVAPEVFAGRLVFVGATALGTQEDVATPVQPLFPGVEIQATIAESLMAGQFVRRPASASFAEAALITLAIPVVWFVSRAGAVWGAVLLAGLWSLLWLTGGRAFTQGLFVSPILPMASVGVAYIATVVADLRSDRARAAARADEASRAAAEAESIKDEVLRKTSHELRTPLTVIAGWAHLLGIGALSDRQKNAALATIRQNVQAQTKLIEHLVDASKLADSEIRLQMRKVDLRDVLKPIVVHYQTLFQAQRIEFDVALDAEPCVVSGDPERLQQIVDSLLSNAAKFTHDGGTVSMRVGRADANVEIVVADNGVGIAPEFKPHVFERFRQQEDMTRQPNGGLGLGLAIVEKLVHMHGGSVSVDSQGENQGATFVVWLPAVNEDE
jgi:signal transduction histidine kinase